MEVPRLVFDDDFDEVFIDELVCLSSAMVKLPSSILIIKFI